MIDIVDRQTRSRMMSGIRGSNTKPELLVRKALHASGFRYRTHAPELPGRPDLVFPKYHAVVFVHGCFWHQHSGCRFAATPSSNPEFWERKFEFTRERDARNLNLLKSQNWRIALVWECAIGKKQSESIAAAVGMWLRSSDSWLEISGARDNGS